MTETHLNIEPDLREAEASLAQNGRTFHWARRFLGMQQGGKAATLYSLCRLLDDMADGDIKDGPSKLAQINLDLVALRRNRQAVPQEANLACYKDFLIENQISLEALQHLIDGLLLDQQEVALQDEDELVRYGYYVAGTVGLMMCPVLGCHDRKAADFAIDMGIAMQLTNIARDVLEDAKMGRRYIPASWVSNLSAAEIAAGAASSDEAVIHNVRQAVDKLLILADRYYQSGFAGLGYLPWRPRIAIAIAALAYRQIGVKLRRNGLNWHQGRTVTSTASKAVQSVRALLYISPHARASHHKSDLHLPLKVLLG